VTKVNEMGNKEFSRQLEQRTKKFAISIIQLSALLTNTYKSNVIKNQLILSESTELLAIFTSIGKNLKL